MELLKVTEFARVYSGLIQVSLYLAHITTVLRCNYRAHRGASEYKAGKGFVERPGVMLQFSKACSYNVSMINMDGTMICSSLDVLSKCYCKSPFWDWPCDLPKQACNC